MKYRVRISFSLGNISRDVRYQSESAILETYYAVSMEIINMGKIFETLYYCYFKLLEIYFNTKTLYVFFLFLVYVFFSIIVKSDSILMQIGKNSIQKFNISASD